MESNLSVRHFSKYQNNQIVFYGDIFGFKQCMETIEKNGNYVNDTNGKTFINLDTLYEAEVYKIDERINASGVNFIWLSDSFAYACAVTKWNKLKEKLFTFINFLWSCDFIFSGALAFGNLHNGKNIMGATFVKAVTTQELCHSPEIIIDSSFQNQSILSEDEVYKNEDSKICFDYIFGMLKMDGYEKHKTGFQCLYSLCSNEINNSNERIRNKYKCMVKMVVQAIEKLKISSLEMDQLKKQFQCLIVENK